MSRVRSLKRAEGYCDAGKIETGKYDADTGGKVALTIPWTIESGCIAVCYEPVRGEGTGETQSRKRLSKLAGYCDNEGCGKFLRLWLLFCDLWRAVVLEKQTGQPVH